MPTRCRDRSATSDGQGAADLLGILKVRLDGDVCAELLE
jgi:hypothetical protein